MKKHWKHKKPYLLPYIFMILLLIAAGIVIKNHTSEREKQTSEPEQVTKKMPTPSGLLSDYTTCTKEDLAVRAYLLYAIANHYIYFHHDSIKGQELLQDAKVLIEHVGLDKLQELKPGIASTSTEFLGGYTVNEDVYNELAKVEGLAEMYARVLYLLGTTIYFHQNHPEDYIEQAVKYFQMSNYISSKKNLFETILSRREGLAIIERDKIKSPYDNVAKNKIQELLATYKKLAQNKGAYLKDYKPGEGGVLINLEEDSDHQLACKEQIRKCYEVLAKCEREENSNKIRSKDNKEPRKTSPSQETTRPLTAAQQ